MALDFIASIMETKIDRYFWIGVAIGLGISVWILFISKGGL